MVSCNAKNSGDTSQGASVEPKGESIQFLDDMGVASTQLDRLGDNLELTLNETFYSLTEDQRVKLLNDIYHFDGETEGVQSIIGVKSLPNGHTLVLFHNEYGDMNTQEIAIYDKSGKMTDHLETGTALIDNLLDADDGMTAGTSLHNAVKYKFIADSGLELEREYYQYEWVDNNGNFVPGRTLWKLQKTYKYRINPDGKILFVDIETKKEGDIDRQELLVDEIGDLQMRPASDVRRLDEANLLAARPDVKKDIESDGSGQWQMTSLLWGIFNENPQALLTWLANHRDKTNNRLLGLFESLFSNGVINKSRLVEEINKMKDQDARQYLDTLTAQWGPIDAVG